MNEIKAMTKRNLLIYFRDKSAVFFSILSALILLAIYGCLSWRVVIRGFA